ncbi:hypothetical protein [Bdellovibrio bacteriovorus]|uniref:hypothetical protein n=1 Tax=Bdellovibrio bacteriovorus TaxID=959 RepID=UPI0035A71CA0
MKTLKIVLPLILGFTLVSCTSDEGMLKKEATKIGQTKFAEQIQQEAQDSLSHSDVLREAFINFIQKSSEVEVEEIKFQGEKLATVSVTVTTYPAKLRRTLLAIASKVDASKSRRFNFAEARSLIGQQGEKIEVEKQALTTIKFHKSGDQWQSE